MTTTATRWVVAVAHACGGDIATFLTTATRTEIGKLERTLQGLADLGYVAAYAVEAVGSTESLAHLFEALSNRVGRIVLEAVMGALPSGGTVPHAYLVPVWPFDHHLNGHPASTARLLGLDLEVLATPSPDEEQGVSLPGRHRLWIVHARPILF